MPTTHPNARRLLAAIALCLLWSGGFASAPALAQEPPPGDGAATSPGSPGFAVQPSGPNGPGERDWFTYTLNPGDVFGDTVAISNLSDHKIRFHIYATDAVSVEGSGGFAAPKDTETPVDVGSWIDLAADEYTVEPGKRIDVPFSVTVPADAEPGDHAGAILAIDADDAKTVDPSEQGTSFEVRERLGARVYVRVGGATAPDLRIDDLSVTRDGGRATVNWRVRNTGNLRLAPTAEVRIKGLFGRTIATAPVQQVPELLPGGDFVGAAILDGMPRFEPLTAELVVKADGVEARGSRQFQGYPWALMLGLGIVVLILAVAWWLRRRRRRRSGPPSRPEREKVAVPA